MGDTPCAGIQTAESAASASATVTRYSRTVVSPVRVRTKTAYRHSADPRCGPCRMHGGSSCIARRTWCGTRRFLGDEPVIRCELRRRDRPVRGPRRRMATRPCTCRCRPVQPGTRTRSPPAARSWAPSSTPTGRTSQCCGRRGLPMSNRPLPASLGRARGRAGGRESGAGIDDA